MIKFTCDICGDNLLLTENGQAVCKNCGAEYSKQLVDEKKKKIRAKSVAETESKVSDLLKTAQRFMADGAFKNAKKVLTEAYKIAPRNYKVILERAKCEEELYFKPIVSLFKEHYRYNIGENGKNFHISVIETAIDEICDIIKEEPLSEQELINIYNELAVTYFLASSVKSDYYSDKIRFYTGDTDSSEYSSLQLDCDFEKCRSIPFMENAIKLIENFTDELSVTNVLEIKRYICDLICDITCYNAHFSGYEKIIKKYDVYRWEIRAIYPDYGRTLGELADPFPCDRKLSYEGLQQRKKDIVDYWRKKDQEEYARQEQQARDERLAQYWSQHADERQRLLDEKANIEIQITQLNFQIEKLDCDKELLLLQSEQQTLKKSLQETSIFAFKQRKELNSRIEILEKQIQELQVISQTQHNELDSQQHKLQERLNAINLELTKDRP